MLEYRNVRTLPNLVVALTLLLRRSQPPTIRRKILVQLIACRTQNMAHGLVEQGSVSPSAEAPHQALIGRGHEGRRREPPFKFADDTLTVTVDVCTDLHDRCAAITTGQRRQHWFRWQARDFHLAPRKSFDAKGTPNFFGNRGLWSAPTEEKAC